MKDYTKELSFNYLELHCNILHLIINTIYRFLSTDKRSKTV